MQNEKALTKAEREHLLAVALQQAKMTLDLLTALSRDQSLPVRKHVRKAVAA